MGDSGDIIRRDPKTGQIIGSTPDQAARARQGKAELRQQRQAAAERVAREALAEYAREHTPEEVERFAARQGSACLAAWKRLMKSQAALADSGRPGSTQAARLVGVASGLLPDGSERRPEQTLVNQGNMLVVVPEAVRALWELVRRDRAVHARLLAELGTESEELTQAQVLRLYHGAMEASPELRAHVEKVQAQEADIV